MNPTYDELLAMVMKYRARLEIDHHYELINGELVRVNDPLGADFAPDKIACLEADISMLEQEP
jgi:hypothetical protein